MKDLEIKIINDCFYLDLPRYLVVIGDAGDAGAARAHWRERGPHVRVRIVHLHAVHALLTVEATGYVYFIYRHLFIIKSHWETQSRATPILVRPPRVRKHMGRAVTFSTALHLEKQKLAVL